MILDAIAVQVSISMLSLVLLVPRLILADGRGPSAPQSVAEAVVIGAGTVVLVIVVPALVSGGASIGRRRPALHGRDGRAAAARSGCRNHSDRGRSDEDGASRGERGAREAAIPLILPRVEHLVSQNAGGRLK